MFRKYFLDATMRFDPGNFKKIVSLTPDDFSSFSSNSRARELTIIIICYALGCPNFGGNSNVSKMVKLSLDV